MPQAQLRIGTRIAGASGGQYFLGDSNGEDQGCEVGQGNGQAAELLPVDHRLGRSQGREVRVKRFTLNVLRTGAEKLFDCQEYDLGSAVVLGASLLHRR